METTLLLFEILVNWQVKQQNWSYWGQLPKYIKTPFNHTNIECENSSVYCHTQSIRHVYVYTAQGQKRTCFETVLMNICQVLLKWREMFVLATQFKR